MRTSANSSKAGILAFWGDNTDGSELFGDLVGEDGGEVPGELCDQLLL